jgi:hypothetical protein
MARVTPTLTVIVPTPYSKCTRHNKIYIDCRDFCNQGGTQHSTVQMWQDLKHTKVVKPIAEFLVKYQRARIVK